MEWKGKTYWVVSNCFPAMFLKNMRINNPSRKTSNFYQSRKIIWLPEISITTNFSSSIAAWENTKPNMKFMITSVWQWPKILSMVMIRLWLFAETFLMQMVTIIFCWERIHKNLKAFCRDLLTIWRTRLSTFQQENFCSKWVF